MNAKMSGRKVVSIFQKAKLSISTRNGNTGLSVSDHSDELISIDWNWGGRFGLRNTENDVNFSSTEKTIGNLIMAAHHLENAGLKVLVNLNHSDSTYVSRRLYVAKDPDAALLGKRTVFNADSYKAFFSKEIEEEKAASKIEVEKILAQKKASNDAAAKRAAQAKLMNPSIIWDITYFPTLKVGHVLMLDGRFASITVTCPIKKEIDWDEVMEMRANGQDVDETNTPMFDVFEVEIRYVMPDKYTPSRWTHGSSNLVTGRDETVESAVLHWIAEF